VPKPRTVAPEIDKADVDHLLRWEGLRTYFERPARTAARGGGLLLLIAIQHFEAGPTAKAIIAGASFIGLIASPLTVGIAARLGLSKSRALAIFMLLAAGGLALAGLSSSFEGYFLGVLIAAPLISASAPLITALWNDGVPGERRGRRFARVTSQAGLVGVLSAALIAAWLDADVARYRPVLLILAAGLAAGALAAARIRSGPVRTAGGNPYRHLSLIWHDRRFGLILFGWFLLGFGNLATMPLRLEHVAGASSTFGYSPQTVLWLIQVLPQAVALVATLYWGRLFDRFHFLALRIVLNVFFASSILCFFTPWLSLQVAGSVLLGVAQGGGVLLWGLWVTRFAPAGRATDYMATHTFLTGVRGLLGPLLAYRMIEWLSLGQVAVLGTGLIVISSFLFVALWRTVRRDAVGAETEAEKRS